MTRTASRLRRGLYRVDLKVRSAFNLPPRAKIARVMYEFARARPGAFVVQIGAHDSSQLDPLRPYILARGWRGLLVEPIPDVFERLKANYAGVPGLAFENAAIAPQDGTMTLHYLPQSSDPSLPKWYDALASFRRDVLLEHKKFIPDIEDRIKTMDVASMTFDSLARKHDVAKIDVIQIDTEGYDFEIVKLIDLSRFRPAVLQIEELHMDDATRLSYDEHVGRFGYETIGDGMDRIAVAPDAFGPGDRRFRSVWRRLRRRP